MDATPLAYDPDALARLAAIARAADTIDSAADAVVEHAIEAFGLVGASISLVVDTAEGPRLESLGAAGDRSAFVRELSMPIDTQTDVGRVAADREPLFIADPHGRGPTAAEPAAGVARWRDGFGTHAYAVLPLRGRNESTGALTLEWPRPRHFSAEDRSVLSAYADVVAIAIDAVRSSTPEPIEQPPAPSAQRPAHVARLVSSVEEATELLAREQPVADVRASVRTRALEMPSAGVIVPAEASAKWGEPVFRAWLRVSAHEAASGTRAFCEALSAPHGPLVIVAGQIIAEDASDVELLDIGLRSVMRAAVAHRATPADLLGMLGGGIGSAPHTAWLSAAVAELDPDALSLEIASVGSVALGVLRTDGRLDMILPTEPPMSERRVVHAERARLLLPGDSVALLGGCASELHEASARGSFRAALGAVAEEGGTEAVRNLFALVAGFHSDVSAAVIEAAGPLGQSAASQDSSAGQTGAADDAAPLVDADERVHGCVRVSQRGDISDVDRS
ncbi:MAG: GAF domain-containing protein [Coriobacteriales bacterium]|nr:GAF domain-containing protein [Coriobacteriales bacterium]